MTDLTYLDVVLRVREPALLFGPDATSATTLDAIKLRLVGATVIDARGAAAGARASFALALERGTPVVLMLDDDPRAAALELVSSLVRVHADHDEIRGGGQRLVVLTPAVRAGPLLDGVFALKVAAGRLHERPRGPGCAGAPP